MITISIIIPVKDTLPYLKKCLDSMLSQTLKNIEIIVVDDHSTQDIRTFVNSFNDDRIVFFRNEKTLRPGGARNKGLAAARGKYIAFCDSDDWVDINYYETVCNYMDKNDADIVMTSMKREYPSKNNENVFMCKYNQEYSISSEIALRILSKEYSEFEFGIVPACMNKIYRKDFLSKINARFEEGVYFQGVLFTIYTFLRTSKIDCIPNVNYHHFKRADSVVQSFDENHILDFGNCCRTMEKYFMSVGEFERYKYSFYCLCNKYFNLIVQELFEFVQGEESRKKYLRKLVDTYLKSINLSDLFEYLSAEEIRKHLQPDTSNARLY